MSTDLVRRLRDYVNDVNDVSLRMEAADEIERLRDLLQSLCDEQNGPPLETRRKQWQRAYDQARAALTRFEANKGE